MPEPLIQSKSPPLSYPINRGSDLGRAADIDATIALWQRTGVDYCDAWWALGKRTPCWGGWPDVRAVMLAAATHWERRR